MGHRIHDDVHAQPEPLVTCYILEANSRPGVELEVVAGIDKARLLSGQRHAPYAWVRALDSQDMLAAVSTAARVARCVRVRRSTDSFDLVPLLDAIEKDFNA